MDKLTLNLRYDRVKQRAKHPLKTNTILHYFIAAGDQPQSIDFYGDNHYMGYLRYENHMPIFQTVGDKKPKYNETGFWTIYTENKYWLGTKEELALYLLEL